MTPLPPHLASLRDNLLDNYCGDIDAPALAREERAYEEGFLACYQAMRADANAAKELSMIDFNKRVDAEERIGELETMLAQGRQLLEADNNRIKELEAERDQWKHAAEDLYEKREEVEKAYANLRDQCNARIKGKE